MTKTINLINVQMMMTVVKVGQCDVTSVPNERTSWPSDLELLVSFHFSDQGRTYRQDLGEVGGKEATNLQFPLGHSLHHWII
jgi:hypothetical protein